jgi:predicted metalloprotease
LGVVNKGGNAMIRRRNARTVAGAAGALALGLSLTLIAPTRASAEPVTPKEADSDQVQAYQSVDGYWRRHWAEFFTGRYTTPNVVGLYDSRLNPMPCDGSLWTSNNAWYCKSTDSVGFDLRYMEQVFDLGDSFIYLVVAHEWGHAIQARLNPDIQSPKLELQADCLAGAALYGAGADGTLRWDPGDLDELTTSLRTVADKYPWTRVGDHGSPAQRISAFLTGAGGPLKCLPELPPHLRPQPPDPGIPPPPSGGY